MARRKKKDDMMGSLDSLLDTMTNVVGVLIVVLIVNLRIIFIGPFGVMVIRGGWTPL